MMDLRFKPFFRFFVFTCLMAFALGICLSLPASAAQPSEKPADPIYITSDQLMSDTENHQAEFSGNVVITQGATRITGDRLKVFFSRKTGPDKTQAQSMEKLVITGNVRIELDNKLAVAKEAVYITKTQVLTLAGPNASITSDNNTISGDIITYYRTDGRFTVKGKADNRVRAVLNPTEPGIQ
ncbi:lipopolysaccharide transport periplasmic protein LptA [Desulfosarcina sp. OttesenSCG-928-G10]|nr:lipopolysaccharide transport periplasmic protein LptA [Desulfosarcina sp. OttesenSCG-928-G10]MDL2321097.1 lipopolysaccharide transport periplasmic protein LptA [Desulfosarcina sp. OttesenSCG-928-B08]